MRYVEIDTGFRTPCHIFQGAVSSSGYGAVRVNKRYMSAHVAAWEAERGPVPDGHELDHKCRVPLCIRTSHLEPVSHAENCRRAHDHMTMELADVIRDAAGTQRDIAARFGVTRQVVANIKSGRRWARC